jgi:hypothetical protein
MGEAVDRLKVKLGMVVVPPSIQPRSTRHGVRTTLVDGYAYYRSGGQTSTPSGMMDVEGGGMEKKRITGQKLAVVAKKTRIQRGSWAGSGRVKGWGSWIPGVYWEADEDWNPNYPTQKRSSKGWVRGKGAYRKTGTFQVRWVSGDRDRQDERGDLDRFLNALEAEGYRVERYEGGALVGEPEDWAEKMYAERLARIRPDAMADEEPDGYIPAPGPRRVRELMKTLKRDKMYSLRVKWQDEPFEAVYRGQSHWTRTGGPLVLAFVSYAGLRKNEHSIRASDILAYREVPA